jgi:hypothetical protein
MFMNLEKVLDIRGLTNMLARCIMDFKGNAAVVAGLPVGMDGENAIQFAANGKAKTFVIFPFSISYKGTNA